MPSEAARKLQLSKSNLSFANLAASSPRSAKLRDRRGCSDVDEKHTGAGLLVHESSISVVMHM